MTLRRTVRSDGLTVCSDRTQSIFSPWSDCIHNHWKDAIRCPRLAELVPICVWRIENVST